MQGQNQSGDNNETLKRKGLVITSTGVAILSFDSLLIRLIEASEWTLLFWRGVLPAVFILSYLAISAPGVLASQFRRPSHVMVAAGAMYSISTICFVLSILHTQVASTLVIINTAPLLTMVMAFFLLKERIERKTLFAILVALSGVWLVFASGMEGGELEGNLYAVGTAFALSTYFVLLRKARGQYASIALATGGIITAGISLMMGAEPFSATLDDAVYIFLLCGLVVPIAFLMISRGPKYLPAAEANLIMLLEAILGPLFVWIGLGEVPTVPVVIGGVIILGALIGNALWGFRKAANK
ncbi:DMT family transporter [Parasalinivibrio latis]|uniref:DMT family transporter n=1 Tax=Parasalinivibrio latis TaxID=2952610 RepID=UPI0030E57E79